MVTVVPETGSFVLTSLFEEKNRLQAVQSVVPTQESGHFGFQAKKKQSRRKKWSKWTSYASAMQTHYNEIHQNNDLTQ